MAHTRPDTRRTADWKAARLITDRLARFDRTDPVRYDFAICRLGILDRPRRATHLRAVLGRLFGPLDIGRLASALRPLARNSPCALFRARSLANQLLINILRFVHFGCHLHGFIAA